MAKHTSGKLNWLEEHLPEGLVVDAAWLSKHGYSTSLRSATQGRATYTMEFKHYSEAPKHVTDAIVSAKAK